MEILRDEEVTPPLRAPEGAAMEHGHEDDPLPAGPDGAPDPLLPDPLVPDVVRERDGVSKIAVVGNYPYLSPEQRGEIERSDYVVRFNDMKNLQSGERTDLLMSHYIPDAGVFAGLPTNSIHPKTAYAQGGKPGPELANVARILPFGKGNFRLGGEGLAKVVNGLLVEEAVAQLPRGEEYGWGADPHDPRGGMNHGLLDGKVVTYLEEWNGIEFSGRVRVERADSGAINWRGVLQEKIEKAKKQEPNQAALLYQLTFPREAVAEQAWHETIQRVVEFFGKHDRTSLGARLAEALAKGGREADFQLSAGFVGLAYMRTLFGPEVEVHTFGMNWNGGKPDDRCDAPILWADEMRTAIDLWRVVVHPTHTEDYLPT